MKVIEVHDESIKFDSGCVLESDHDRECCEWHYLSFRDLSIRDFEGLDFDLSNDNFFNRIPGYGIELVPVSGFSVKVPGYGENNGYYSSNLSLVLSKDGKEIKRYDIEGCQAVDCC